MDERLKHRIVGVAVIVALLAIFAPLLFKNTQLSSRNNVQSKYIAPPPPAQPQVVAEATKPTASTNASERFAPAPVANVNLDQAKQRHEPSDISAAPAIKAERKATDDQEEQQRRALILGKATPASTKVADNKEAVIVIEQPRKATVEKTTVAKTKQKPVVKKNTKLAKKPLAKKPLAKHHSKPSSKKTIKKVAKAPQHKAIAKAKPASKDDWVIQLGAFGEKANAVKLMKRVEAKGFSSFIRSEKNASGKTITRVYVGPEAKRARADQLRNKLQQMVNIKGFVVREHG